MDWLSQNWVWVVVIIGFLLLMRRGGLGGCGMGHAHQGHDGVESNDGNAGSEAPKSAAPTSGKAVESRREHQHHGC